MRDQRQPAGELQQLVQPLGEGRLVGDHVGGDAVQADVDAVEVVQPRWGPGEPRVGGDDDAVADDGRADRADGATPRVGGLDVDGDEVQASGSRAGCVLQRQPGGRQQPGHAAALGDASRMTAGSGRSSGPPSARM